MIADYFTKPLQGVIFNKFRSMIMGWEHIETLRPSTNKEHVENHVSVDEQVNPRNVKKTYADAVNLT